MISYTYLIIKIINKMISIKLDKNLIKKRSLEKRLAFQKILEKLEKF